MKEIIICFLCCFVAPASRAQSVGVEAVNKTVFLLPEFANGKVLFLNGTSQQVILNYNELFEQVIFQQNGLLMALDQMNTIDTVFIDSMKFVPVDTIFYEVRLEQTSLPLYTRHRCIVTKAGAATPFGGNTQTGAVQKLSSYRLGIITPYQLKPPDDYTVNKLTSYFIKVNDQFTQIKSLKKLGRLYPGSEKKITRFIKDNDIGFNKIQDLEKLLLFIGTFKKN